MDKGDHPVRYQGGGGLKPEQKAKKAAYDKQYMKEHVVRKLLAFNITNDRDRELLEHINSQTNATEYIKNLIMEDMKKE